MLAVSVRQRSASRPPNSSQRRRRQSQPQPLAEVRVREQNLQQQQRLARAGAKFERDRGAWTREDAKRRRGVLQDLSRMLDARLTPTVDDWFAKRRIRQASRQEDGQRPRRDEADANHDGEDSDSGAREAAEELRNMDRQRLLELKRRDWSGVTSVGAFSANRTVRHQSASGPDVESTATATQPGQQIDAAKALAARRDQNHNHYCRTQATVTTRPKTAGPVLQRTK